MDRINFKNHRNHIEHIKCCIFTLDVYDNNLLAFNQVNNIIYSFLLHKIIAHI